jgi:hypothetical protein
VSDTEGESEEEIGEDRESNIEGKRGERER